ncbi:hypothetical protein ACFFRR_006888 [Megaselia abdita]
MPDLLLSLDNKEVLTEILHHSVDTLINRSTKRESKIHGNSPEDFESTVKSIANNYKLHCLELISEDELMAKYSHINSDLQRIVLEVFKARKPEIMVFLLQEHNAKQGCLMSSFDWNVNLIFGDSSLPSNRRAVGTVAMICLDENSKKKDIHFEVDRTKLDELIKVLEAFQ